MSAWKVSAFVKAPRETHERRRLAEEYTSRVTYAVMSRREGFQLLAA